MTTVSRWSALALTIAAATALTACNTDSSSSSGTGSLSLDITDAPVDNATEVIVTFTGISLKHEDGPAERYDFDEPRSIDLLALQGDASDSLLDEEEVRAGRYQWVRLHVEAERNTIDSWIKINNDQHSLYVPSGAQSGLKLISGFEVPVDGSASFTIDFDLRKSLVKPQSGEDYFLKPALRLIDNSAIGHVAGTVDDSLYCEGAGNAVYVFAGHDATPIDINTQRDGDNPVTTANVSYDTDSSDYRFKVGFLTEGDYTLAFTCDAGDDDPEADDTLDFSATLNTAVTAGETTNVTIE